MMKVCLLLALTIASVSALQDGPEAAAAPEPFAYSYQTDTHGAAEQRDQQGRVTGYYTLTDADGRERRVDYVADAGGFRAKVATNEVGTKAENPADVEVVAAEPSPAQYAQAAQYTQYQQSTSAAAAPAQQSAQFVRQQTYQTAAAPQQFANYNRVGYTNQQYAYRPYGASNYYYNGATYPYAYGSNYNGAYGGYGAAYYSGGFPSGANYYSSQVVPAGYYGGYTTNYGPASQYYSYRSSSSGTGPVPEGAALANSGAYRSFVSQPAGAVTTTYRQYSSGTVPAGVSTYSSGFPTATRVTAGSSTGGSSSGSSSGASYQGSSNYIVLKKRDAEKQEQVAAASRS